MIVAKYLLEPSLDFFFIIKISLSKPAQQVFFFPLNNVFLDNEDKKREQNYIPPVADKTGKTKINNSNTCIHRVTGDGINAGGLKRVCR